ncbi:MAG: hypothetical protein KJO07_15195 [Deltaproteobacteria bacterium]|nr:hypothetical protein [Deltaproteobacteria bacterium]
MSGFLKGIFGAKEEDQQVLGAELGASDEMEQLQADVQGTVDTKLDPSMLDDGESIEAKDHAEQHATAPEPNADVHEAEESGVPFERKGEFSAERVWTEAGVTDEEQATVHRAQSLLAELPSSTPDAVKRQIVEAALKAFDISISDIVVGASSKVQALNSYIEESNDDNERFIGVSEARIEALEAEIAVIRETMKASEEERDRLVGSATEVIDQIQPVLDFFGPSKSPKIGNLPAPATPVVAAKDSDD